MTAPTLERLSEEELDRIEARGRVCVTCGEPRKGHKFRHLFVSRRVSEADIDSLVAEVRAHRAAALSEADRESLTLARGHVVLARLQMRRAGEPVAAEEQCIAILDRLIGRSAT